MWSIVTILVSGCLLYAFEGIPLKRANKTKELTVFSLLLALAIGWSIAQSLTLQMPSPLDYLSTLLSPVSNEIERFSK